MTVYLTGIQALADALESHWSWDAPDHPTAEWAVGVVSALIRGYTRLRIIATDGVTLTLTGTRSPHLVTGERPLRAVTSVSTVADGVLPPSEYRVLRSGVLVRAAGWGGPDEQITVVANVGFDTIPDDLAAVAQLAAVRLAGNPGAWRSQPDGMPSDPGVLVAAFPGAFTIWELAVLNRYRRRAA